MNLPYGMSEQRFRTLLRRKRLGAVLIPLGILSTCPTAMAAAVLAVGPDLPNGWLWAGVGSLILATVLVFSGIVCFVGARERLGQSPDLEIGLDDIVRPTGWMLAAGAAYGAVTGLGMAGVDAATGRDDFSSFFTGVVIGLGVVFLGGAAVVLRFLRRLVNENP